MASSVRQTPPPAVPTQSLQRPRNSHAGETARADTRPETVSSADPVGERGLRTETDPGAHLARTGAAHGDVLKHPVLLRVGLRHERRCPASPGKRLLVGEQIVEPERGVIRRRAAERSGAGVRTRRRWSTASPTVASRQQRHEHGKGLPHLIYFFVTFT